jgi:tRNA(Ile)-lysidine synthase
VTTAPPRVAVAASGGPDSTALLHATVRAGAVLGVEVFGLHVHHGLMPQADAWLEHVRGQCRRWGAAFEARRLVGAPPRGDSIEAWARRGRWAALAEMARAHEVGLVLLAHHRGDQAETWLLQALRGGGPAGLSAMPRLAARDDITWARPWLDQPRAALTAYLRQHRLKAVDDSSNADVRFARARLQQQVWPALSRAFADAEASLAASAERAQEAAVLLAEIAAADLSRIAPEGPLDISAWKGLAPARRANALRHWLAQQPGEPSGREALLRRLQAELLPARGARWSCGDRWLVLRRGRLTLE